MTGVDSGTILVTDSKIQEASKMTGRLVAMILGFVLMVVGVLISLTIVGAIVGVPLAIVGLLLFLKGIF